MTLPHRVTVGMALHDWLTAERAAERHRAVVLSALRPMREATGLSLREAARRAGISPAALSRTETGHLELGTATVARLVEVLVDAALEVPLNPEAPVNICDTCGGRYIPTFRNHAMHPDCPGALATDGAA
jgi:lambda repressor-like predicted transcriptional regulator